MRNVVFGFLTITACIGVAHAQAPSPARDALMRRGSSDTNKHDWAAAIADFTQAAAVSEGLQKSAPLADRAFLWYYPLSPDASLSREQVGKGIADASAAIALDPGNGPAYFVRGYGHQILGRSDGDQDEELLAIQDFEQSVVLTPDFAEAWFQLGAAQGDIGDKVESQFDIAKARRLEPGIKDALGERAAQPAPSVNFLSIYVDELRQRQLQAEAAGNTSAAPVAASGLAADTTPALPRLDGTWLCTGHPIPSDGGSTVALSVMRLGDQLDISWPGFDGLFPQLTGIVKGNTVIGNYTSSLVPDRSGTFRLDPQADGTLRGSYTRPDASDGFWTCRIMPRP